MPQRKQNASSIVYSTDSNFNSNKVEEVNYTVSPAEQKLSVSLDKKHRGGKMVTIVDGYRGSDIEETGKQLKKFCGTGGSVKDGFIIIQGDNRDKISVWLTKNGYKHVKK